MSARLDDVCVHPLFRFAQQLKHTRNELGVMLEVSERQAPNESHALYAIRESHDIRISS